MDSLQIRTIRAKLMWIATGANYEWLRATVRAKDCNSCDSLLRRNSLQSVHETAGFPIKSYPCSLATRATTAMLHQVEPFLQPGPAGIILAAVGRQKSNAESIGLR